MKIGVKRTKIMKKIVVAAIIVAIALAGFGAWYFMNYPTTDSGMARVDHNRESIIECYASIDLYCR